MGQKLLINVLVLCVTFSFLLKASGQWAKTNGPYGGRINSLYVRGNNLYAGSLGGIFISTNNGIFWKQMNINLTRNGVNAFANLGSHIFAATGEGVFITT